MIHVYQYRTSIQLINRSEQIYSTPDPALHNNPAKRYFATIALSPEELDSFRAFLPVIDNFYHFQLYVKIKQKARKQQNQFNYGYEQNNREATAAIKRAANPSLETMGGQKSSSL